MTQLRLSRLMAMKGLCSRREADHYIEKGWVLLDGVVVNQLGVKANENQSICLLSQATKSQKNKLTVILNKPVGYVSGTPEKSYKPAASLICARTCAHKPPQILFRNKTLHSLAPAGRLDIDSQGLLVLTQDGRIARQLVSPDSTLEKEYLVRFRGYVTIEKIQQLTFGLSLDGRALKPAKIKQINESQLQFVIIEGRKRQIRRMCGMVDLEVLKLQRVRIGKVRLANLPLGQWRCLKAGEVF